MWKKRPVLSRNLWHVFFFSTDRGLFYPGLSIGKRASRWDIIICHFFQAVLAAAEQRFAPRWFPAKHVVSPNSFSYQGSYFKYRGEGSQIFLDLCWGAVGQGAV